MKEIEKFSLAAGVISDVDLETAKLKAQAAIDEEIKEEEKKVPWYKKIFGWVGKKFIKVVQVVFNLVTPTVVYIINSEKNQTLAKLAVLTAIEAGLKGENAFAAAWKILHEGKIWVSDDKCVDASNINTNIKQTLIQLVYTCIKNKINSP